LTLQTPAIDALKNYTTSSREVVKWCIALLIITASGATNVQGQSPDERPLDPPVLTAPLEDGPDPVTPQPDPIAAEKIQNALRGETPSELPPTVLGDVIGIIRQQGSVLDGSSLDPRLADDDLLLSGTCTDSEDSQTQPANNHVQTAEALLRAARMLESVSKNANNRSGQTLPVSELARQMRIQATLLLVSEFPQAIQ
jgi:hypothetical protein